MMIRMVVTKANSRDNLNCDFDDRYYDEADDGDGPTLNGSVSPITQSKLFYYHGHDHRGHDRMQQTHEHQQH